MENRISVVTIIVADKAAVPQVNACLHEYGSHIGWACPTAKRACRSSA